MANDLELITELEIKIRKILPRRFFDEIIGFGNIGFATDDLGWVSALNLDKMGLKAIPAVLPRFRYLEKLSLYRNRISDLQPLSGLINLTALDLRDNQIRDLGPLSGLTNLTELDLDYNRISDVEPLSGLTGLRLLNLMNNKIAILPPAILGLNMECDVEVKYALENKLYLYGNPLEQPPPEIIQQGKKAMRAYLQALAKEKQLPLREAKILLVGDGGAGKTSLVKCLLGRDFDPKESQTHGINIDEWLVNEGKDGIKAHLWDFGGQEIMHATHQFFLSKRSLYVLVLDGRRDEKTEYWLKHIESFGGDSPVLVVLNKVDQNPGFDVNRNFLRQKYENIKGFFRLSCADKKGMEPFCATLRQELEKVELIHTTWPESWFNIKSRLDKMTDDYISFDSYVEMCRKENIAEQEAQHSLAEFLHDLGIVLHFEEPGLRETNVINPKWATGAVYKIINSEELAENEGILHKSQLKKILDKSLYPLQKHDFILELMKKFELCFYLDGKTILVPDLLAVNEPKFDFDYDTSLKFLIQYDFLPLSIMPRFIVKMRKDIKNKLRWRTGVVLADEAFASSAVIRADEKDNKISIFVQGQQKRDYFSVIRKVIRDISSDFKKIEYKESTPLMGQEDILVEYEELLGLERMKEEYITIGKLGKKYPVKVLLDGIEDENYREYTNRALTGKKDFKWDVFISYSSKDKEVIEKIRHDLKAQGISYWWDEEQIRHGESITEKIADGLFRSRNVLPCFSRNQLKSGWSRVEYTAILSEVIGGKTARKVIPLIIDDLDAADIPILMRNIKYERYANRPGYEKLLQELKK